MIEIYTSSGKISLKSFAEAHGLGETAASTRLQRAVKNGEMRRIRKGNKSLYLYEYTKPRIKAHDPFNLSKKAKRNA